MARDILERITRPCGDCEGHGLVDAQSTWAECRSCHGLGRHFTAPRERVEQLRRLVIAEYPEAAAGSIYEQPPHRPRRTLARAKGGGTARPRVVLPVEYARVLQALAGDGSHCARCELERAVLATPYRIRACPGCLQRELAALRARAEQVPDWAEFLERAAGREVERQRRAHRSKRGRPPAPADTPDQPGALDRLIAYCSENGRVCPVPLRWQEIWEILPQRGKGPPRPLILSGWWYSSDQDKALRFRQHLRYAAEHGVLAEVSALVHDLSEEDWHVARVVGG